jgi:hypothetical protein
MIQATIKRTGMFIDKPQFHTILIEDEDVVAVQKRDEDTNKLIQLTIRDLFDGYSKNASYLKGGSPEIDSTLFVDWFNSKYITGKGIQTGIISIEYKRL